MSENHQGQALEETGEAPVAAGWLVDEWGRESFPASDPPSYWAGADVDHRTEGVER